MIEVLFRLTDPYIQAADCDFENKIKEEKKTKRELFEFIDLKMTCTGELHASVKCYGHLAEAILEQKKRR